MEKYVTPEMELIELEAEDTIMASTGGAVGSGDEWELPSMPITKPNN